MCLFITENPCFHPIGFQSLFNGYIQFPRENRAGKEGGCIWMNVLNACSFIILDTSVCQFFSVQYCPDTELSSKLHHNNHCQCSMDVLKLSSGTLYVKEHYVFHFIDWYMHVVLLIILEPLIHVYDLKLTLTLVPANTVRFIVLFLLHP